MEFPRRAARLEPPQPAALSAHRVAPVALRRPEASEWLGPQLGARRGGQSGRLARPSGHPRPEVLRSVRQAVSHRDAAARLCFRRAEARSSAMPLARVPPVWRQARVAAWCRRPVAAQAKASPSGMKAAAGSEPVPVRPVASAPQALLLAAEVASASGAKVRPPGAAEAESGPSARQPGAEAEASAAEAQPLEAEEAVSGVGARPPEAAGVASGAVAEPQQAGAAALLDAEVLRPGAVEEPAPSARQPAAERPSAAPWVCRRGRPLPWLAPRRAVRSAHAMRRSRAASPSRQSWRAAGCGGLS
ncbi:hypothetical protein V1286_007185 [Bradyrhizobium algeriense]|uniref:Uncharacterized protein n=1 Tax=Bradyrhizobium algeriense TaxID=634784 RepID=A0ABU8BNI6_9BRAD